MALTNRERTIMIVAVLAVLVLIADRYVLSPVLDEFSAIKQQKETLQATLEQSMATLERGKKLNQRWTQMQQAGLSYDVQKTEGLLLRYLEESSSRSRFLLTSIQPEHSTVQEKFGRIDFTVSGTGSMETITRFLWDVEKAQVPLKIESLQLGANDENARQMSLQVKLSSIYLVKAQKEENQS